MSKYQSISVFFPCFNEEKNILGVYDSATKVLHGLGMEYEIIFVNDGSIDGTKDLIEALVKTDPHVHAIHHSQNLGYGMSLQSGIRAAKKDLVFYSDGDGQFDLQELAQIIPLIEDYDIVSCYRRNRQEGLMRKFNAWAWSTLVCTIFPIKLKDVDCAFKLYRRAIFDNMELVSKSALIDTEILTRAVLKGCTIIQTGVTHYPRKYGTSTGSSLPVILRSFSEIVKYQRIIKEHNHYV